MPSSVAPGSLVKTYGMFFYSKYFERNEFGIKDKTYVIVIFKEDGTSGGVDCAPVFKEISENIVRVENGK